MRTLIISDLHLGSRLGYDVLRQPAPLQRLVSALEQVDRLVLLGDAVELMEGRAELSMAIAEPVLRAVGARLPRAAEVILVPGNHDLPFIRPWIRADPRRLQIETRVPNDVTPQLARVAGWLGADRVQVRYPGVWLAPGVWATHGHYLDRHLLPESAFGISRGLFGPLPDRAAVPADYERRRRPSIGPVSGRLPRPLAALVGDGAELLRAWTMPRVRRRLLAPRMAPLTSGLLALQMRRASIPVLAHVAARLGVEADWLIFGHVHRRGPLAADDPAHWRIDPAGPRILNTGSWLHEPVLVNHATPPHPYWPGGAVLLEPGAEPRSVGLLDELTPAELQGSAPAELHGSAPAEPQGSTPADPQGSATVGRPCPASGSGPKPRS